jgi:hypothetical protein
MFTYLVYLQTHDVRSYADGRLGRRDLTALRKRLSDPDRQRLAFLRHLAGRLGFVVRRNGFLRLEAAPARRWLDAPMPRQQETLQAAWRDDPAWIDLCRVPGLVCDEQTSWHQRYDPVATRRAFLSLLARCPLDGWWSLESFVQAVKETHPDFQRPDGDYEGWYIRDAQSGEYLSGIESWDQVEGALISDLLTRPLCWLGTVTTARVEADAPLGRPFACRLTKVGARFLGLLPGEPDLPASLPIVVQPDFRVQVPAPVNLYTRFQLERFADLESTEPCRYALTVGGLGRGLARGIRVEQVLAFLQQASEAPVPVNVAGQLRLWAERFGQVELEETVLLTVKNERVLRELFALPQVRPLIGQVLSPTTAQILSKNLPRLRRELAALGYLPPSPED